MNHNNSVEHDVNNFWSLLFNIILELEKRLFAHLAAHRLTPPQFYVLKTLSEHGGRCRIGQIAKEHHLTNATMTGLIKRLEAMNPPLVCREQSDSDGRSVDVMLTPEGMQRFLDVQHDILQQVRTLFGLLPADERQQIIEKLQIYFSLLTQIFPVNKTNLTP